MRMGIFGGSFDPVHSEHVGLALAAKRALGLDRVVVVPSYVAPHKRGGAAADGKHRLEMCRIAFGDLAEVSDLEIAGEGTSYTYLTCRRFRERYPEAGLFFLVGADMLENFFTWKRPEEIVRCVTLAACGRGERSPSHLHRKFVSRFGTDFAEVPFTGEAVSSTEIRVMLAFGKTPEHVAPAVLGYIRANGLYEEPAIAPALALEKPERREHSFRVALMACKRARSLDLPEEKALLAAALHDCAKYVPADSPLLAGCALPQDVPEPVVHQYTGAYLAEHLFGVADEEVLDAIRYHASGREDMTPLGKLIYLADLLEEGRAFSGIEELRALFWKDLDACFAASLERQLAYLEESGKEVYPLTKRAFLWLKHA